MPSGRNVALVLACAFGPANAATSLLGRMQGMTWGVIDMLTGDPASEVNAISKDRIGKIGGLRRTDQDGENALWDYSEVGLNWKQGQCCVGNQQSPVNLTEVSTGISDDANLFFSFPDLKEPLTMLNDGHMLVTTFQPNSGWIAVGKSAQTLGTAYQLDKILVHSPSEHTFEGERVDLELQIYHRQVDLAPEAFPPGNTLAAVSVGFKLSQTQKSAFLENLRAGGLPIQQGTSSQVNKGITAPLDFTEIFGPGSSGFWQYEGSRTAPPCSVGVQWFVRDVALPASAEMIADFRTAIAGGRPIQSDNPSFFSSFINGGAEATFRGNARGLMPSCDRSKVLRLVRDAYMTSSPPGKNLPTAQELAVQRLDQAKADAQAAASADSASASSGDQDAQSPEQKAKEKAQLQLYTSCAKELTRARQDLAESKKIQKAECDGVAAARAAVEEAGSGSNRLREALKLSSQRELCQNQNQVVSTLEREVELSEVKCEELKP
eukprot:TRINITY_DN81495_c0_g1_i1.p1 TRINITY_DN81495_c0_g1~~TRINITY_DN81495_c0_g1_i1.p1  ORF type:complete len:492 (-),score=108.60 TRINITY_DN81495_c0_g1_i1:86-1561(-)